MTIRALILRITGSKAILECRKAINKHFSYGTVRIKWTPGHHGVIGNEKANILAYKASALHIYIHIWLLQPVSQDYVLVSYVTYVVCVLIC